MNGNRLIATIFVTSLALGCAACSPKHDDSSNKAVASSSPSQRTTTSSTAPAVPAKSTRLVAVTWCDPKNAGYRTVQKFDLNGTPVGDPAYFNVTPTGRTNTGATEAGCNPGIDGAEMSSAFVVGSGFDTIVTTKVFGGSIHEGFEYSVKSIPAITDGSGALDPTPNNFYDITGLSSSSTQKVTDLPGAMGPDKKVYFVRVKAQAGGPASIYVLMRGDANNPAKPIRQLNDPGAVFFAQNATEPYLASDSNTAGRGTYVEGGNYGFGGTDGGINFGTRRQLDTGGSTYYKVTGVDGNQILHPFHVYNKQHLLASTEEGIYDVTVSGDKATAKKLASAPGYYIGDAQLVGNTIMFVMGDDNGDHSLFTVPVTSGAQKKVYTFPHGTTGDVNLLGTVNAS